MPHHESAVRAQPVAIAALAGAFALAFHPVMTSLVRAWSNSDENSHGFFIVPVAVYLLWIRREELQRVPVRTSWAGLGLFLAGLLLYLASRLAGVLTAVSFSMILTLWGLTLYLLGPRMVREMAFPLFLLCFMVPVPTQFYAMATAPLQLFVSQVSTAVASAMGISLYREGNVIHLPTKTLEVVQACSGLRSLNALFTLSLLLAYFGLPTLWLRGLLVLAAVPTAVLVNVVRILGIIVAWQYWRVDLADERYHTYYGLGIFLLALAALAGMQKGLLWWHRFRRDT